MRRLATLSATLACAALLAPAAQAANPHLDGSDYVLQPGQTITFSGMILNSCDADQAGVNLQQGSVQAISFGTNTGGQCTAVTPSPMSFTNSTDTVQTFRLWLQDNSCSFIYFADGGHAKVRPKSAALNDSGPNCVNLTANSIPKGKTATFVAKVSFS